MNGDVLSAEPSVLTGALVGYGRVSTKDQRLDRQIIALTAAGCERIFTDKKSGKNAEREELGKALDYLRPGDTLVVASLDRLARSLQDLISLVADLRKRGIGFRSLKESLDTTTPGGRLVFHVFAALAEFIRELIIEGTHEGLAAARERGVQLGRPPALTSDQVDYARAMLTNPKTSVTSIAKLLGVSRATIYKYLPELQTTGTGRPVGDTAEVVDVPAEPVAAEIAPAGPMPTGPVQNRPVVKEIDMSARLGTGWTLYQREGDADTHTWLLAHHGVVKGKVRRYRRSDGTWSKGWEALLRGEGGFVRHAATGAGKWSERSSFLWRGRDLAAWGIATRPAWATPNPTWATRPKTEPTTASAPPATALPDQPHGQADMPITLEEVLSAAEFVITSQFGSAYLLQIKRQVPLSYAQQLMEILAEHGIVGPDRGPKAREVLVPITGLRQALDALTNATNVPGTSWRSDTRVDPQPTGE